MAGAGDCPGDVTAAIGGCPWCGTGLQGLGSPSPRLSFEPRWPLASLKLMTCSCTVVSTHVVRGALQNTLRSKAGALWGQSRQGISHLPGPTWESFQFLKTDYQTRGSAPGQSGRRGPVRGGPGHRDAPRETPLLTPAYPDPSVPVFPVPSLNLPALCRRGRVLDNLTSTCATGGSHPHDPLGAALTCCPLGPRSRPTGGGLVTPTVMDVLSPGLGPASPRSTQEPPLTCQVLLRLVPHGRQPVGVPCDFRALAGSMPCSCCRSITGDAPARPPCRPPGTPAPTCPQLSVDRGRPALLTLSSVPPALALFQ